MNEATEGSERCRFPWNVVQTCRRPSGGRRGHLPALVIAVLLGTSSCDGAPDKDSPPAAAECSSGRWWWVAAGRHRSCGVREDGCAECWGYASPPEDTGWVDRGQMDPPDDVRFHTIDMGVLPERTDAHSCGITTDRTARCWAEGPNAVAPPAEEFESLAAGVGTDTVVGITTGGHVQMWGVIEFPSIWDPNDYYSSVAVSGRDLCVSSAAGAVSCFLNPYEGPLTHIALNERHELCGLDPDGRIQCVDIAGEPVYWDVPESSTGEPFVAQCTNYEYACGLTGSGVVECAGAAVDFWFGDTPSPPDTFVQIDCGPTHACGVTTDARIVCWGDNGGGQLDVPE